ncbi:MAG: trigger factor [bacterium]|nr:trigger factor [bacterium]
MFGLTTKKLPQSRLEIKGAVGAEEFKSYRGKAVAGLSAKLKLPGFRPGHVPEKVLVEKLGEGAILEEMAELALAQAYPEILREHKIDALDRPEIKITKMAMGDELAFTIETDVYPEVTLPDYEKLVKTIAKEEVKDDASEEDKWRAKDKYRLALIKTITTAMTVELPRSLVQGELEKMLAELKASIEHAGFPFHDYLKQINKTEADLRGAWEEQAKERVKFGLFTNALAGQEQLYPDEIKIKTGVEELKKHYPEVAEARLRTYVASSLATTAVWQKLENIS